MLIGFIAALVSNWAIRYQKKLALDDTLDVFASHGIGGVVGMILTGVLAEDVGLVHGQTEVFLMHIATLIGVAIFAFCGSYGLYSLVNAMIPLRVS